MKYYKYENCIKADRNFNPHLRRVLAEGELFFSKPSTFEDYEDCSVEIYLEGSDRDILDFANKLKIEQPYLRPIIDRLLRENDLQTFAKLYSEGAKSNNAKDILGIFCLSKYWNNKKMWDYYASSEGICFGYDVKEYSKGKYEIKATETFAYNGSVTNSIPFIPVKYITTKRPKVNRIPDYAFQDALSEVLLMKDSAKWGFENEVRSIVFERMLKQPLGEKGIALHCNPDTISEIIFSPTTNEKTIKEIKDIISQRPSGGANVHYYRISDDFLDKTEL